MQVCSGSEELKVDTDSQPMMRYMMQKLYDVSQAFNKSGRSKLLVPIDVALENHFADDKIMKVRPSQHALMLLYTAELTCHRAVCHVFQAMSPD